MCIPESLLQIRAYYQGHLKLELKQPVKPSNGEQKWTLNSAGPFILTQKSSHRTLRE